MANARDNERLTILILTLPRLFAGHLLSSLDHLVGAREQL
jgi:hypothetical protein